MNKGMGHKFLKHVERTKQLLFVVCETLITHQQLMGDKDLTHTGLFGFGKTYSHRKQCKFSEILTSTDFVKHAFHFQFCFSRWTFAASSSQVKRRSGPLLRPCSCSPRSHSAGDDEVTRFLLFELNPDSCLSFALQELELYKEELVSKPALLVVNKMDLPEADHKLEQLKEQLLNPEGKRVRRL